MNKIAILSGGDEPVLLFDIPAKVHFKRTRCFLASQTQSPRLAAVAFWLGILLATNVETLLLTRGLHVFAENVLRFFRRIRQGGIERLVKDDASILMEQANARRKRVAVAAAAVDIVHGIVAAAAVGAVVQVVAFRLAGHQIHQLLLAIHSAASSVTSSKHRRRP